MNMCKKAILVQTEYRKKIFLDTILNIFNLYIQNGARSSKKVDKLHEFIKDEIISSLSSEYSIKLEQNVNSCNMLGKKRCDIVLYKNNLLFAIFPVKFIMTSYNKNKNNYWENLTGELTQIKWCNKDVHLIPINIIFNKIPILKGRDKTISSFEDITYDKSFKIYEKLTEYNITTKNINYIIDVKHQCNIEERYNKPPILLDFNKDTPYHSFYSIISNIIQ